MLRVQSPIADVFAIRSKTSLSCQAMSREHRTSLAQDPLRSIAATPPQCSEANVRTVILDEYGLDGALESLLSERDQNFRLTSGDGRQFVFKIANALEPRVVTDFQIQALLHIEKSGCPVVTPHMVGTRDGKAATTIVENGLELCCRLVTYVPGRPLAEVAGSESLARNIGRSLAAIDAALRDFSHEGENQPLLWDLQRALEVRPLLVNISDVPLRESVEACLDEFESVGLPRLRAIPSQVIHGDLNTGNLLVALTDATVVAGVIDFGDMVRAPRIVDLAIAASYMRSDAAEPLALLAALVAGYHSVEALAQGSLELLFELVRVRLATSITMLFWRLSARSADDPYRQASLESEANAARFFATLGRIGRSQFLECMSDALRPELAQP